MGSTDLVPPSSSLLTMEPTSSLTDVPLRDVSFPMDPSNLGSAPVLTSRSSPTARSSPLRIFVLHRKLLDTRSLLTTTWLTVTPFVTLEDLYPISTSNSPRPRESSPTLPPLLPLLSSVLLSRLLLSLFLLRRLEESLLMVLPEDPSWMFKLMLLTSVPLLLSDLPTRLTVSMTGLLSKQHKICL